MRALVSYLLISFIAFGVSNAAVINVPEDHETIQEAINASQNGDTVLVAPGEYTENINLIGRDISLIGNPNNPAETMIFAAEDGSVITYSRGETRNSILSGFTISGGTGNQIDDQHYGGGIFILDSSPSIDHCIILNNHVDYGGGAIVCLTGRPRIDFCLIYSNSSDNYGGAFFIDWEAWPEIWDCTIIGNQAENSGGGYFLQRGSRSHIFSSIFWQNEPQEIFLGAGNGNRVQIYFSTIMNGMDGIVLGNGGFASLDEGSTDMDPLFVDPDSHDYRPRWDSFPVDDDEKSPCIDGAHYRSPSDPDDTRSDIGAQYFDQGEPSQMYFDPSMLIIEEPGEYVINISTEGERSLYWQLTPDVDWLRVEPTEGLMYPEQDIDVFVLVIEEQLERGRYTTDLIFRANNPNEREFVVETILYYEGGRPPRWEILPDEFLIIEGDQISFELEGIDPGGEEVSMRMARGNLPRSGQFTDNGDGTGSFNWQTSHFDSGQYNPEFILTDGVYLITAEVPIIVEDYMQEFDLNTPPNGSEIDDLLSIDFNWNSASREPEIEDVSYKLHLRRPDSTVVVVLAADTAIAVGTELISRNHDSDINIRWEVWAYDGFDSLRCSEQFEFVFPPLGINPDNQFFIPELLTLHGSFPNPFNSSTIVRFSIGRATDIHIGLYGIDGKIISPLHSGAYNVGNYQLKLNLPSNLPSGIYLLRFRAEQTIMHQRIVLIR
jgi:hypothetical protein